MAIFHMQIKPVSRAQGRNAPASAAYRAGELIRNERTGAVYDHRKRQDVLHKEIMLPAALERSGSAPEWLRERSSLWNAAERAEHRSNSRVAREYMVALPAELSGGERIALARAFSREIADRFSVAVDLAVHEPRPYGDPRNFHAHLLTSTREVTAEGLGAKTGLDMEGTVRAELGVPTAREQFKVLRERWAELTNEALENAHVAARVDHRSLAEQGIDREPRPNLPMAAVAALRRGERSVAAERLAERYQERVAARQAARAEQAAPPPRNPEARRQQAVKDWLAYRAQQGRPVSAQAGPQQGGRSVEDLRRQAIEAWRSLRAKEGERRIEGNAGRDPAAERGASGPRSRDHSPDSSL